jgi:two-component system, repressor protein LuxO
MQTGTILIVEDSRALALTYQDYLARGGNASDIAGSLAAAQGALVQSRYDAVLLDMNLPDGDGMQLIAALRAAGMEAPVIVLTAEPSIDAAVAAIRVGAQDYLCKPVTPERLNLTLGHLLEQQALRRIVHDYRSLGRDCFCGFTGASPAMQVVYHVIENAAQSRAPVFITGESGTGKELAAQALHKLGPRRSGAFEALNCAAVPGSLMESEIFGHARGAFTGAVSRYAGAAERAHGGTLFLDELPEMPPEMQSKLLRLTQNGVFRALGAAQETVADLRFVCATNRDPLEAVAAGLLREDLYYRLNVISVHLPPLRERGDDVILIASRFLAQMAKEEKKSFAALSENAADYLRAQAWPGNVRQLQNVLRRTVVMHEGEVMTAEMLAAGKGEFPAPAAFSVQRPPHERRAAEAESLRATERRAIEKTIEICGGNISAAARRLEINPSTLHRKLARWRREGS